VDDPVRLWCDDLDEAVGALQALGVRLDVIQPADSPMTAELSGGGRRFRLERRPGAPAPDAGRAGMVYRDLLPGRGGGRFIASHITIRDGGPVPDYVHHHEVRFQLVHCLRGWVRVVYEGQGTPFVMERGDTVLQPPHIRHRVLESSSGLEVLEFTSPAEHPTIVDHDLTLPTVDDSADRDCSGQRFVRHEMSTAAWLAWRPGFEAADTGIDDATGGRVGARTVRASGAGSTLAPRRHDAALKLWYVECGRATLHCGGTSTRLSTSDAIAVPAGVEHSLRDCTADLRFYEVTVPA
jgi:mannose-6-phosphate isomerase-like protein (cupin superfamily)